MLHIGILGAARIAPAAIIQPAHARMDCRVVSVAARDAKRAREFANAHSIERAAASYEDLIGDTEIDLIYNALPPHRHADLTIAALRAGKHVLCEKPFAMNASEARAMVNASRETGLHLIEAFHYRFHPAIAEMLTIVRNNTLGTLRHIEATFSVEIPYVDGELRHTLAVGGGALMDLGCYPVHWLRTISGETPTITRAVMGGSHPGVDLTTDADFAFASGLTGHIHTSMARDVRRDASLKIEGADGTLHFTNPLAPHMGYRMKVETRSGASEAAGASSETTYAHQLAHVIDVLAGRAEPLTGGDDAVANMAAIDAIYRAAGWHPRGHEAAQT